MDKEKTGGIYAAPTRKPMRLPEYNYSEAGYYFITICTHGRQPVFANAEIKKAAEQCLAALPHHVAGLSVDMFCVMPDHIHAILVVEPVGAAYMPPASRPKETLIKAVQQYKAAVTRLTGIKPLWQRGYYDHILRNDLDLRETREYIQNNPRKAALALK